MKTTFKILVAELLLTSLLSCLHGLNKYDRIVDVIKKLELPIGKLEKYKIEDFSYPFIIKKLPDSSTVVRGKGKGRIWVFKTKENLLVFIETEDNGHAGEYGLAYSESGQFPEWNNDEWGEFWSIGNKINSNWWNMSFRLGNRHDYLDTCQFFTVLAVNR
jgi:hypothetical protein